MALRVKVLMVKVPVVVPAATVATRGTDMFGSVVLRATIAPPEGAAAERVIVQVLLALELSVDGLHCSEEMLALAERLMLTLCAELL